MRKFPILISLACCFWLLVGFNYSTPKEDSHIFTYNNLTLGDTYADMLKTFGKPRYHVQDKQYGVDLTYYYYKDNTRIGIAKQSGKILDMELRSDHYAQSKDLHYGDTTYKLDRLFGPSESQHLDGKIYYPYAANNQRALFRLDPTTRALIGIRLTTLPVEEDSTPYLDDSLAETINPLYVPKPVDTTALTKSNTSSNYQIGIYRPKN